MDKIKMTVTSGIGILETCSEEELRILRVVSKVARECAISTYAIGGFVRDKLLNRPTKDLDFVCLGDSERLAKRLSESLGNGQVNHFKGFGVSQLRLGELDVEIVTARKESYQRQSRKPIVEVGTLEDDFLRRDFTINALAIDLQTERFGTLLDPCSGLRDIQKKILRTPRDPDIVFRDDPLRMMRAMRFAVQLGYAIEEKTYASIIRQHERLGIVSQERIIGELHKMMKVDQPSVGFDLMEKTQLLTVFFPEMIALKGVEIKNAIGHKDNFYHTLQVLDNVAKQSDDLWLRWAAILHDIAKPQTKRFDNVRGWTFYGHEHIGAKMVKRIFRRLRLPLGKEMQFVQKLVLLHLRPISLTKEEVSDSAVRRLLFEAGDDIESLMLLCECDITSKREEKVVKYLNNFRYVRKRLEEVEAKDKIRNFKLSLDGLTIMRELNIPPSKEVGKIKQAVLEAVLDGKVKNTVEATIAYMRQIAKK